MSAENDIESEINDCLLEEAAVWFMRLDAGEIDETSPDYRAWLQASPDHEDAMIRARITWSAIGDYVKSPELIAARRDALSRSTRIAEKRWRPFLGAMMSFGWPARAAAAAVVIAFAAVAAVLTAGVYFADRPGDGNAQIYATDVGETRVVTLADNSRVTLDAFTRIEVRYDAEARDIALRRGQAHFDVATDAARPFRVTAGDQTVVATGTAFNVELVEDEVFVTLIEGEVVVTGADGPAPANRRVAQDAPDTNRSTVVLKPGQQLLAARDLAPRVDDAPNLEKATAWRQGKVFLEEDALMVAVARMNRYSRIRLVVADASLEQLEIGGVFNAGDTDAFIEALESYFPIEARRMSASTIELHPRG